MFRRLKKALKKSTLDFPDHEKRKLKFPLSSIIYSYCMIEKWRSVHVPQYLILSVSLFFLCSSALADERILSFHSEIHVRDDSSMEVVETIQVRAERKKINRGIYRDFPTDYKDRLGNKYRVGFEITGVKRDGRNENYHTKSLSNGVRIYFGHKDRMSAGGGRGCVPALFCRLFG